MPRQAATPPRGLLQDAGSRATKTARGHHGAGAATQHAPRDRPARSARRGMPRGAALPRTA
eukprot:266921-Alexandrium_andersonii.AAC.1